MVVLPLYLLISGELGLQRKAKQIPVRLQKSFRKAAVEFLNLFWFGACLASQHPASQHHIG